jgi:molybdate transport system permease protein
MLSLSEYWRPLVLSMQVAAVAVLLGSAVGLPLAYVLARRRFPGRSWLEGALVMPLVLPPTVVGFLMLYILGRHGLCGWLTGGVSLLFTFWGAVAASVVVVIPLIVLPARAAFAGIDRELWEDAAILGLRRDQVFFYIALPLARGGVVTGLLLAFGRALGEFGATLMVLGAAEGMRTLPVQIYLDVSVSNDVARAAPAVLLLAAVSMVLALVANHLPIRVGRT